MAAQSFVPTFFDSSVIYELFRFRVAVSNLGTFALSANTTGASSSDEIAARGVLVGTGEFQHYEFDLVARENVQLPGHPPGFELGTSGRFLHILDDGSVVLSGRGPGGNAVFRCGAADGGQVIVEGGVTTPEDQAVPGTPLSSSITRFVTDAAGQHYVYTAFLASGGSIIAVNNVVVCQTGRPAPGGYPAYFPFVDWGEESISVAAYNGHYSFRNPLNTASDAVIIDGRVVAVTGDPIVFGSAEIFGNNIFGPHTTFVLNSVNSRGDYLLVGHVNIAPTNRPQVCVWNRRVVLMREGDPVDLDGNGLGDDGVHLGTIDDDEAGYLTDNGRLYFVAELRDEFGIDIGRAFMWLPVPIPGDPNCDGRIDFFDIDPFLLALFDENAYATAYPDCWRVTADINRDGSVDFFDIDPFLACLFDECP